MALNYSSKHDISYTNYNNKTIPWKVNTSIISQNNQMTNPSLNLGTINNNLVIESSQNDILFITPQNNNKKVIVKNNMDVNVDLDVSNNLTTKLNVSYDINLNNIIYFPSLPVNIIGDLKVGGAISIIGEETTGLVKSESQFVYVTLSGARFTDVSIVSSTISVSDFSNVNIINSYINAIPNGFGYDKSNNAVPNKAIFSDVSLQRLILDSSINSSYINFANNTSNAISIRSSADYSKLIISKPLNVGPETINNISNISIFYGDISCNNLYYSRLVPDIKLNNYSDVSIGNVSISGNNVPTSNMGINIGSNAYKFNNTYSTYFNGDLSGQATLANNLIKNLDMSFNNLDICGTFTLNNLNLNQFLSSDLTSIVDGNSSFINISNKVRDLSAIVYSKSDFDLCLNTHIAKISLVETSFVVLNGNITSISASVYSKSDFDLSLNSYIAKISLRDASFGWLNNSITSISASVYSKSDFDLSLNSYIAKISLRDASFGWLNNSITSISASVYSKSDFDLCLNINVLRINDVSAIATVVSSPPNIYPTLGYNDSFSIKVSNAKVTNELAFPYAITYIDDLVEDTNLKESYSYRKTTTRYTNSTTTKYIATATTVNNDYYDAVPQRQPNDVNLTRAVMVYVNGDSALTPGRDRTWSNTSASNTLPAVYLTVKLASPRVVSYEVNTTYGTWEYHRINAQQVRGRYLATILSSTEQTAAANARGSDIVWIGGRRKNAFETTGGTIITSDLYKIHRFTDIGISYFRPNFNGSVEVLLVGGGGGGGGYIGGGGGGGGVIYMPSVNVTSGTNYTIFVGDGGRGDGGDSGGGTDGQNSTAFNAIAAGGGGSMNFGHPDGIGRPGGSGGGAAGNGTILNRGGDSSGNSLGSNNGTPNSGTIYGNRGGNMTTARTAGGAPTRAAGGGGAGGQGLDTNCNITGSTGQTGAGSGGVGVVNSILGPSHYWGGGGGGGAFVDQEGGWGGLGGGGGGAGRSGGGRGGDTAYTSGSPGLGGSFVNGGDGGANTGGGGGGANGYYLGGNGGSGIVVIRYLKTAELPVNDKSSDSWEWHNGDTWGNYENFATNEPSTRTQTNIVMWSGNTWDDQFGDTALYALYMTYQLQPITSADYEGNTSLMTWNNHKTQAQTVRNRFMATIENYTQNTWVGNCISSMSISDIYKNGTGTYIGAMRTSGSNASGYGSSDWQWSDGATWSYSNFYRQGVTQLYAGVTTTTYSAYIPQQPTRVTSSAPEGQQPITINVSNTKLPTLISSVNGSITVTSSAISALNLPASTTSNMTIGNPNSSPITTASNNNKEYTTTITTYTTTDTYAYNGTALVISATATGGNNIDPTTDNLYRIHRFTSNGTFTPSFNGTVEVLLVGGGGGGGSSLGGGGGGGSVIYMPNVTVNAGQNYTIEVGTGGPSGNPGLPSKAFTAIADGGGSSGTYPTGNGTSGGSGGGAAATETRINLGGGVSTVSTLGTNNGIIYGNKGGDMTTTRAGGVPTRAAGGGGAGGQGLDTNPTIRGADLNSNLTGDTGQTGAGSGGVGIINNILGTSFYWGGGGGGGAYEGQCGGYGGFGGGGGGAGNSGLGMGGINAYNNGSNGSAGYGVNGGAGGAYTGGGGGGGSWEGGQGGRGGDGIVIIRYLLEQPIGSFKISENNNNKSYYIKSSASALPSNISTSYSCIAITNDGMFVALGKATNVTVYMKTSTGWTTIGSPISINFTAYTNTDCNILWNGFDSAMYKNLQNLAINYITGSNVLDIYLAFGDARSSVKLYSYTYSGTSVLSNGFYNISTSGTWVTDTSRTRTPNIAVGETSNTNFGYFVTLSHNPIVLGFTVDDKFYTYNTSNNNIRGSRKTLSLPTDYSPTTKNIVAFKVSSDAEKIIVSNTYYVFVYKWDTSDWALVTTISLLSTTYNSIITFTYGTSTTKRTAAPRSLDISNISSDECVFAIGFPDVLIDTSANRRVRGYVEYWKLTNTILTRLARLVPRKRNIDSSNVDTDEYFFSAGGIKITNANTILVSPNFKFHFNNNKNYTLATNDTSWNGHNNNAKLITGREMASIENEADNELVKISARNNLVWIGAMRTAINNPTGITSAEWQWSDLSSSWNYTSFTSGQPNNFSEKRIQSLSGTWYDTLETATSRAVYMTRLQYSLNTFTIFNNFFLHSSGFSSSYTNTAIATAVIAKWVRTDSPSTQPIEFRGNGDLKRTSQGIFTVSDIRLKENIVDSTPKLEDLLKVRVVNYNLKGSDGTKLIGVVAQELEQIFPTLVNNGELSQHDIYLGKTESYKSVKYSCFDVILIKAFQEQMAIINKLSAQLDDLECKTKSLKTISQDFVILKQELDLLKSENELFKLNINEILKLI